MCQKLRFLKSAAKLLYHTAKTCQYVDFLHKKAHFMKIAAKIQHSTVKLRQSSEGVV